MLTAKEEKVLVSLVTPRSRMTLLVGVLRSLQRKGHLKNVRTSRNWPNDDVTGDWTPKGRREAERLKRASVRKRAKRTKRTSERGLEHKRAASYSKHLGHVAMIKDREQRATSKRKLDALKYLVLDGTWASKHGAKIFLDAPGSKSLYNAKEIQRSLTEAKRHGYDVDTKWTSESKVPLSEVKKHRAYWRQLWITESLRKKRSRRNPR